MALRHCAGPFVLLYGTYGKLVNDAYLVAAPQKLRRLERHVNEVCPIGARRNQGCK